MGLPNGARAGEVPLGPLQEAFAASGMTVKGVARTIGCDEAAVRRLLRPDSFYYKYEQGVRRGPFKRYGVTYEVATKLARAMNVDPYEVGI